MTANGDEGGAGASLGGGRERFARGLEVRRAVLGAEYVDASIAGADHFTAPLQELVTEYCWGEVWTRPTLSRKTRSLLNLAMLTALNRPHELRLHTRGALANGCSWQEIQEALLQATIYAGVPAGVDAFRVAREVLEESGGVPPSDEAEGGIAGAGGGA
jgi:4-carboxymuconolactone decarboxylase